MTRQKRPVQQSITRPATGKVLTGPALAEVKGGVVYDMVTSPAPPRVPAETLWG
jgi:hypothetical protein